jgi:hypothetical protein
MSRFWGPALARRAPAPRACAIATAVACALALAPATSLAATSYSPGAVSVDGVLNGPWSTSQGDASAGAAYPSSDLFPTYTPGGSTTTLGGVTEPNLAVYPGANGTIPYPSGAAGTPGPLDGICASGGANPESGSLSMEPANTDLPMAPYYFPDVVRNADGSLTGYFDWRPKDDDEAITVARSTDGGLTWTTEGIGLEQNTGYCPTADTNDDGEGHPYVASVAGNSLLYTLQRPAGDYTGVGLLVHPVGSGDASDPLSGVPATERVGVDPNTFATGQVTVPTSGGVALPVSTLGSAGSPDEIVAGPYIDETQQSPTDGSAPTAISCTGTATSPSAELTGCTVAGATPLTVAAGDDLVQAITQAAPGSGKTYTIPASSNQNTGGTGGLGTIALQTGSGGLPNTTAQSNALTYILNVNAPNRVYIDGHAVYCVQSNANPTTKLENCTSPTGSFTVNNGDYVTADPVTPPTATMSTGLLAPDGIVGTLPSESSYNGTPVPAGATTVLYTEKVLNYFIVGTINGYVTGSTFTAATGGSKNTFQLPEGTINYSPSVTTSEPLPASGSFTIYLGSTTAAGGGSSNPIQAVTCTGWTTTVPSAAPAGSVDLTGCSGGTGFVALGNWVGGPNSAIAPYSVLAQIGEGKNGTSSGPEKLFGNNEDYTVLRAAYTTDGVNFTDLGPVSGTTSGTGSTSGGYSDVSNPLQQYSPASSASPTTPTLAPSAPANLSQGASDQIELRYIGSRGAIVTNPDGSIGMFLTGAWASDGDSDAFNQIFYVSSTDGGQTWSVPRVVLSTDYSFAASYAQNPTGSAPVDSPLGISAYYSGRAYGPTIVQNPDGSLTMVFAGYRLPKPITTAGTAVGTNAGQQYVVGATDPALYRNIMTMNLTSASSPAVTTASALQSSDPSSAFGAQVTYTDTVSVPSPGAGVPTGTVDFFDGGTAIAGCQGVALSESATDTATCAATPGVGSQTITAVYSGDSNYAGSTAAATQIGAPPAPPACSVAGIFHLDPGEETAGDEEQVSVQAAGGLSSIQGVVITNGVVSWPDFSQGTTSPVVVTAIKAASAALTTWQFTATDGAGQTSLCI